jgi:hypothetical protein
MGEDMKGTREDLNQKLMSNINFPNIEDGTKLKLQ